MRSRRPPRLVLFLLAGLAACSDVEQADKDQEGHSHGLSTRLGATFTPVDGGEALYFEWADPELDGSPVIDEIVLEDASSDSTHVEQAYLLELEVWNDLEDPPEEVTPEILELATEHWFFFTGAAVESSATGANDAALIAQSYSDQDENGVPIGVVSEIRTLALGTADMTVTLRHMAPLEDGAPTKVAGLDEVLATEGSSAVPGGNDIQVVFPVTVQ